MSPLTFRQQTAGAAVALEEFCSGKRFGFAKSQKLSA